MISRYARSLVFSLCDFQATRNTGKSIADRNIANPTAMLLASCMMLDHLK